MKVLMLSDLNSIHTIKWVTSLAGNGVEILLFGFGKLEVDDYNSYSNVDICAFNLQIKRGYKILSKFSYLKALPKIKKLIRDFAPDLVHAHYASSYGLLASLAKSTPLVVSVWGADVFDFPKVNFLNRKIIIFNLKKADIILSTSHVMANETKKYTDKDVIVTPFGINVNIFRPMIIESKEEVYIGTIKTLEKKYGISYLLDAFSILKNRLPNLKAKLLIVGGGSLENELKKKAKELMIDMDCIFTGKVTHDKVLYYHNMLDIPVFLSILDSESFGVAAIEASACGKPVIVSNVGGLPEVIENDITGLVVPVKDSFSTANAIEALIKDESLRKRLGNAGRALVVKRYNWDNNLKQMIDIYNKIIK